MSAWTSSKRLNIPLLFTFWRSTFAFCWNLFGGIFGQKIALGFNDALIWISWVQVRNANKYAWAAIKTDLINSSVKTAKSVGIFLELMHSTISLIIHNLPTGQLLSLVEMLICRRSTPSIKSPVSGWREALWEQSDLPKNTTNASKGKLDPEASALTTRPRGLYWLSLINSCRVRSIRKQTRHCLDSSPVVFMQHTAEDDGRREHSLYGSSTTSGMGLAKLNSRNSMMFKTRSQLNKEITLVVLSPGQTDRQVVAS